MTRLTPQRAFCPDFGWTTILVPDDGWSIRPVVRYAGGMPPVAFAIRDPFAAAMREKARADAIFGKGRP